jgi:hypothetical protein
MLRSRGIHRPVSATRIHTHNLTRPRRTPFAPSKPGPETQTHLLQSFAARPIPNPPHMITFFPIIPKTGLARSNEAEEDAPHMMVREAFSAPFTPAFFSSNQILDQIGSDRIV